MCVRDPLEGEVYTGLAANELSLRRHEGEEKQLIAIS